jgi:hypothetical protein
MANYQQLPAEININIVAGDGLVMQFDASIDLTGYTFQVSVDDTFPTITVSPVDLAAGKFNLVIPENGPAVSTRWRLRWTPAGGVRRTAYAGRLVASEA